MRVKFVSITKAFVEEKDMTAEELLVYIARVSNPSMTSNSPTEESSYPDGYAQHILFIKLWEWEAIIENAKCQIMRHGPEQTICEAFDTGVVRIKELKAAIAKLKSPNPINTTP
jgi:hypothetical protein